MPFKDTNFTYRFGEKILDLKTPQIMGILNTTPDSFSDGGQFIRPDAALFQAEKMLAQGASIIDIGGYSTRPGAEPVSESEELSRVIPILKQISKQFPKALLSVDTFRANVAQAASENGATIVNDISGGDFDPSLFVTVSKNKMGYVLMHHRYSPTKGHLPPIAGNIAAEITQYFTEKILIIKQLEISPLFIDPGFGFGKTTEQNFQLFSQFEPLKQLGHPILAGLSRKSMLYKTLQILPQEADNATTAANMLALMHGASILRVHNISYAKQAIDIFTAYQANGFNNLNIP